MTDDPKRNGVHPTYKWLTGLLVLCVLSLVGGWAAYIQLAQAEQARALADHRERIVRLEVNLHSMEEASDLRFRVLDGQMAQANVLLQAIKDGLNEHRRTGQ